MSNPSQCTGNPHVFLDVGKRRYATSPIRSQLLTENYLKVMKDFTNRKLKVKICAGHSRDGNDLTNKKVTQATLPNIVDGMIVSAASGCCGTFMVKWCVKATIRANFHTCSGKDCLKSFWISISVRRKRNGRHFAIYNSARECVVAETDVNDVWVFQVGIGNN
jgi:hypothetical protein